MQAAQPRKVGAKLFGKRFGFGGKNAPGMLLDALRRVGKRLLVALHFIGELIADGFSDRDIVLRPEDVNQP